MLYNANEENEDLKLSAEVVQIYNDQDVEQNHSLKHLQMFANSGIVDGSIMLHLHKQYPLGLHCDLINPGFVRCHLASQVDDLFATAL